MAAATPENNYDGWGPPPGPLDEWYLDRDGNTTGVRGWIHKPGTGGGAASGGAAGGASADVGSVGGLYLPSGGGGGGGSIGGGNASFGGAAGPPSGGLTAYPPFYDISPIDLQGLKSDRAPYERVWDKLQNVVFRRGFMRSRPGINEIEPDISQEGRPLAIFQLMNPGSTKAREGCDLQVTDANSPTNYEILRPIVDINANSNWKRSDDGTSSNFWSVLNTDGDQNLWIENTSAGAINFTVGLEGPSLTSITHVIVHVVTSQPAAATAAAVTADVLNSSGSSLFVATNFSSAGQGSANPEMHEFGKSDDDFNETLLTSAPQIKISITGATAGTVRIHSVSLWCYNQLPNLPTADVTTSGWTTTPIFSKVDDVDFDANVGTNATGAVTQPLGVQITNFATAPDGIQLYCEFEIQVTAGSGTGTATLRLKNSSGTIIATCDTVNIGWSTGYIAQYTLHKLFFKNENTGVAFTAADLTSAVLEFEVLTQSATTYTTRVEQMWVQEITTLGVDTATIALCSGTPCTGLAGTHRIVINSNGMYRLDNETSSSGLTDVSGTVPDLTHLNIDVGFLYGQAYVANGCQSTLIYPNASNVFEVLSGRPQGRAIAGFADRILLGWTTDAGETVPERIIYSNFQDGTDFTGDSAGDFDLIDTPGGVVKLLGLTEDICAAYKQVGIYNLRRTGDDTAPIVPDLVDASTETIAPRSVVGSTSPSGSPLHFFLGRNAISGLNVFSYDGATTVPVGDDISGLLIDRVSYNTVALSFAGIDPEGNNLWLFVPLDSDSFPAHAFSMNLRTKQWTGPHVFTEAITCIGRWDLIGSATAFTARPTMMVGRRDGNPYKLDYTIGWDIATKRDPTTSGINSVTQDQFAIVIETGDLRYAPPQLGAVTYRAHIHYIDRGKLNVVASASHDGGITFNTELTTVIGTDAADGSYRVAYIDVKPDHGKRPRFKFQFTPEFTLPQRPRIEISELLLEVRPAGEQP